MKHKFGGCLVWKEEMDNHELWPRMSKELAKRNLENRDAQQTIRLAETSNPSRPVGRTFVPASLRAGQKNTTTP